MFRLDVRDRRILSHLVLPVAVLFVIHRGGVGGRMLRRKLCRKGLPSRIESYCVVPLFASGIGELGNSRASLGTFFIAVYFRHRESSSGSRFHGG